MYTVYRVYIIPQVRVRPEYASAIFVFIKNDQ